MDQYLSPNKETEVPRKRSPSTHSRNGDNVLHDPIPKSPQRRTRDGGRDYDSVTRNGHLKVGIKKNDCKNVKF